MLIPFQYICLKADPRVVIRSGYVDLEGKFDPDTEERVIGELPPNYIPVNRSPKAAIEIHKMFTRLYQEHRDTFTVEERIEFMTFASVAEKLLEVNDLEAFRAYLADVRDLVPARAVPLIDVLGRVSRG